MRTRTTTTTTTTPAASVGAALLALLAGCGTTQPAGPAAGASPAASAEASSGAGSLAADESSARGTNCADDRTVTSTGPVTLTDAFGRTVQLERPAQRVAVLEWQQVEDVLTLCVDPVAVADVAGFTLGTPRRACRRAWRMSEPAVSRARTRCSRPIPTW